MHSVDLRLNVTTTLFVIPPNSKKLTWKGYFTVQNCDKVQCDSAFNVLHVQFEIIINLTNAIEIQASSVCLLVDETTLVTRGQQGVRLLPVVHLILDYRRLKYWPILQNVVVNPRDITACMYRMNNYTIILS